MEPKHFYDFGDFQLHLDERLLLRVRDAHPFSLPPKAFELLLVLVKHSGQLVTYGELKKAVWLENHYVEDKNLIQTIYTLRAALGDSSHEQRYIETVPRRGYRFVANVRKVQTDSTEPVVEKHAASAVKELEDEESQEAQSTLGEMPHPFGVSRLTHHLAGHRWQVITSCVLYALLYSVSLLVEVAYKFDQFGLTSLKITPLVFLWIFCTSGAGLDAGRRWTLQGKTTGLVLTLLIFVSASLLLYAALEQFFPALPIIEARFQTYTAHEAYLKSIYLILPLAVVFLILPFHFVLSIERELQEGRPRLVFALLRGRQWGVVPRGAIYLKVWQLALLLLVVAAISLTLTAYLFDNLKPSVHTNLFMQLVQLRLLLYFTLGVECLLWYYWSLNEIKRKYLGSGIAKSSSTTS